MSNAHFLALKMSFRTLVRTPLTTLLTLAAIGICLSLPMSLYLFIKNVQQFSHWNEASALTLYINPHSTQQEIDTIAKHIKQYPFVQKTTYLTPTAALKEFQEVSGLSDTLALLPENPLPGVFNIQLHLPKAQQQSILTMKEKLETLPQVMDAVFDYAWIEKLNTFLTFGKKMTQFLYLLISCSVILIVGNTIRLALEHHREEIEVLTLIGATRHFIRRPFLYRGILYGLLGGLFAISIILLAIVFLQPSLSQVAALYQGMFSLTLSVNDTLVFLGTSALLGWLGAAIAFTQQSHKVFYVT